MSRYVNIWALIATAYMAVFTYGEAAGGEFPGDSGRNPYMKQCPGAGQSFYGGYHYLPGTDTCFSIGGYLWAEYYYNNYTKFPAANSRSYTISTYGFQANALTDTEHGTLSAYIDIRLQYRTAQEWGFPEAENNEFQANPWTMYGQFGGLTFGILQSMFDFYANINVYGTDPGTIGDQEQITLLAYTFELAQGWSATISLEDAALRNDGVNPADANSGIIFQSVAKSPDIVAAIGQSGDWGKFQLSGALHHEGANIAASSQMPGRGYSVSKGSFWGYALQAGVMFNLPHIAEGDSLYLQTAYVDGAVSYLGLVNASGIFAPPDAFLNADGSFSAVSGWNATFQYLHNFNTIWNAAIFGGYASFDLNNAVAEHTIGASGGNNYSIGGNIVWQPNAAFNVSVQYEYNMYEARNYTNTGNGLPVRQQASSQLLIMAQRMF